MNQFFTIKNSVPNASKKLLKLKVLLQNSNLFQKNQSLLINSEKTFNFSPDLEKNLPLYLSLIEKPVNLLFSLDQFLFEFSKKTYQQRKTGEFFQQLKERKKLSVFYGYLSQKQLQRLFVQGTKKKGYFTKNILSLLERRLDVVVYRSGLVKTIAEARQLIRHQKIQVNSRKITVPSYCLNPGDIISLKAETIDKKISEIQDQIKNKRKFLRIFGELFSRLQTNSYLTRQNFQQKKSTVQSKIVCNSLIQLMLTRIKLRSFLNVNKKNIKFKNKNFMLALLKWKTPSISLMSSKNSFFEKNKQSNQQEVFYACGGSLQKSPIFWSTRLTNLIKRIKNIKIQREFKSYKSSQNLHKKNQILLKDCFLLFLKHLSHSKKFSCLISLNLKKYLVKRSHYSQKSVFKKVLDFRTVKPIHLEISYNLLTIIYLFSPQRINFPFYIDLDLIKRSFR